MQVGVTQSSSVVTKKQKPKKATNDTYDKPQ